MTAATHTPSTDLLMPITSEFRQMADLFAARAAVPERADQVRNNTLAVCVVNAYLQLLEIPTAIAQSDSWNPMMQMLGDVTDLQLPGVGAISCRVVASGSEICEIPPEEWHDRIGYVAVQLDAERQQAKLLGFWAGVPEMETLPLSAFGPMEGLVDCVYGLEAASEMLGETAGEAAPAGVEATQLGRWLEGSIASAWQTLDTLVNPAPFEYAFRRAESSASGPDLSRARLIDLGIQLGQSMQIALVVHLTQLTDGSTDILLQVRPQGESPYLQEGLRLTVLDEAGAVFMEAMARDIDNYIQLRLSGQPGESFDVAIALGETTFSERFMI